ncbi:MAG: hypothetical protein JKY88_09055 [Pseudomonadales bacterium]|nr:hypothetical protein [Pseudomonadales bacterium]
MNPTFIQQDPGIERRRRLAEAMLANQKTGPVRTGMEGLGRMARSLAGGYAVRKAGKEQEEYTSAAQEDLARIMSDYSQDVRPLSQHPGTQDIATQIQLSQIEGDKAAEAAHNARFNKLKDMDISEQIKQRYREPKKTSVMQNAGALGLEPGTPEYNTYIRASTKKGPLVQIGGNLSKGEGKADEKFGDEYQKWITGGFADVQKSISQLEDVSKALGEPDANLTGPTIGRTPDLLLERINPQSIATREAIEEIVQRNLRLILGAQFTEKEGTRLIKRAYNPNLSETENKKRVDRLLMQIKTAAEAKQASVDYFAKHGTLKGWAGHTPQLKDFDPDKQTSETARPTMEEIEAEIQRRGL